MKCKFCGKEIEEGSTFCGYCGEKQPQVKYCIKCGHEIGLDDKWCGYCGADQSAVLTEKGTSDKSVQNEEPTSTELLTEHSKTNEPLVLDNTQANNDTIQEENTTESEYIEEPELSNRKYLTIGIGTLIVVIACVVSYFTFGNNNDSQDASTDDIVDTTAVEQKVVADSVHPVQDEVIEENIEESQPNIIESITNLMTFSDNEPQFGLFSIGMSMDNAKRFDGVTSGSHGYGYDYRGSIDGAEYTVNFEGKKGYVNKLTLELNFDESYKNLVRDAIISKLEENGYEKTQREYKVDGSYLTNNTFGIYVLDKDAYHNTLRLLVKYCDQE